MYDDIVCFCDFDDFIVLMWKLFINTYSSLTSFAKSFLFIWISKFFFRFNITIMSRNTNFLIICKCIIDIRNYMQFLMCIQTCSMTMSSTLISTSWIEFWNHHDNLIDDDDISIQNSHNINETIAIYECFRQIYRFFVFYQSHRFRQYLLIATIRHFDHLNKYVFFLIKNRSFNKFLNDWSKCNLNVHSLRSNWTKSNLIDFSSMSSNQKSIWNVR